MKKYNLQKIVLSSVISSLICGSVSANTTTYTITGDDSGSPRNNALLKANLHVNSPSRQSIYVWATTPGILPGEFCYSPSSGWTPSIVDQKDGTLANGKAHCQEPAGVFASSKSATVDIFSTGMNISDPMFDNAMVYVGVGSGVSVAAGGGLINNEYSNVYTVGSGIPKPPANQCPDPTTIWDITIKQCVPINTPCVLPKVMQNNVCTTPPPPSRCTNPIFPYYDTTTNLCYGAPIGSPNYQCVGGTSGNIYYNSTDKMCHYQPQKQSDCTDPNKPSYDPQSFTCNAIIPTVSTSPLSTIATGAGLDLSSLQKISIAHYTDIFTLPQLRTTGGECTNQHMLTKAWSTCVAWDLNPFGGHLGECTSLAKGDATYTCDTYSPLVTQKKVMNCDWYLNLPIGTSVQVSADALKDVALLQDMFKKIKKHLEDAVAITLAESSVSATLAGFSSYGIGAVPTFIATFSAAIGPNIENAITATFGDWTALANAQNLTDLRNVDTGEVGGLVWDLSQLKSLPINNDNVSESCGWSDWH